MLRNGFQFRPILTDLTLLLPDGTGGGGGIPDDDSDIDKMDELGDAGKSALKKERQARRDAAKAAQSATDTLATVQADLKKLQDAEADRQREAAKRAEKDQEQAGKFEELARTREQERDKAVADLAAVTKERDELRSAALGVVKSDFDTLPEVIRDMYTGAEDDPVAMLTFIPKGKKAQEAMDTKGKEGTGETPRDGAPQNPKPEGTGAPAGGAVLTDEQAREAMRRSVM